MEKHFVSRSTISQYTNQVEGKLIFIPFHYITITTIDGFIFPLTLV